MIEEMMCQCGHDLYAHADFVDACLDMDGNLIPIAQREWEEGQCMRCDCKMFEGVSRYITAALNG